MSAEFNTICYFLKYCDKHGNLTWSKTSQKLAFLYYFNDENQDLEQTFADVFNLKEKGWKLSFVMEPSKEEPWNYDYGERVEFVVHK